jgi:hypothetical protein
MKKDYDWSEEVTAIAAATRIVAADADRGRKEKG